MSFQEELERWLNPQEADVFEADAPTPVPLTPTEECLMGDALGDHLREVLAKELRWLQLSTVRRETLERVLALLHEGQALQARAVALDAQKILLTGWHTRAEDEDDGLWTHPLLEKLELLMTFQWVHEPQGAPLGVTPLAYLEHLGEEPQGFVEALLAVGEGVTPEEALERNMSHALANLDAWDEHTTLMDGPQDLGPVVTYDRLWAALEGWRKCANVLDDRDRWQRTALRREFLQLLRERRSAATVARTGSACAVTGGSWVSPGIRRRWRPW